MPPDNNGDNIQGLNIVTIRKDMNHFNTPNSNSKHFVQFQAEYISSIGK